MKLALAFLLLVRVALSTAAAAATAADAAPPPRDDSIRELLEVTKARALLESMMQQVDGIMQSTLQQVTAGKPMSERDRRIIDSMQAKLIAVMQAELSWEKLEPMYLKIYGEAFTQEDVDGMLAFYRTPAGQALINKMPLVVQRTMEIMQGNLGPMMEKIQAIQEEMMTELMAPEDEPDELPNAVDLGLPGANE